MGQNGRKCRILTIFNFVSTGPNFTKFGMMYSQKQMTKIKNHEDHALKITKILLLLLHFFSISSSLHFTKFLSVKALNRSFQTKKSFFKKDHYLIFNRSTKFILTTYGMYFSNIMAIYTKGLANVRVIFGNQCSSHLQRSALIV